MKIKTKIKTIEAIEISFTHKEMTNAFDYLHTHGFKYKLDNVSNGTVYVVKGTKDLEAKRKDEAEDIISQCMVNEEIKLRKALNEKKFHSVILLNQCRRFFNMIEVLPMNPNDFKECI